MTDKRTFDDLVRRIKATEKGNVIIDFPGVADSPVLVKIDEDHAIQILLCNVLEINTVHLALDSLDHEAAVDRVIEALEDESEKHKGGGGHHVFMKQVAETTIDIVRREFGRDA